MIVEHIILRKYNWGITLLIKGSCKDIPEILDWLRSINCPKELIQLTVANFSTCNKNIGCTYSNYLMKRTIMIISTTTNTHEETNTITHECYHFIEHIRKALNIEDEEELATLTGNLNMTIFDIIGR